MSISPEIFIVVSLMLAVFAAIAAVGTSLVLGVGYERLRAGFEIVKKQTGFFADAIHQLDQRAENLEKQSASMKESVASLDTRVDRVEKQSSFFFESLNTLEAQILSGHATEAKAEPVISSPAVTKEKPVEKVAEKKKKEGIVMPKVMEWSSTSDAKRLLQANQDQAHKDIAQEKTMSGLTASFLSYLSSDNSADRVVYH